MYCETKQAICERRVERMWEESSVAFNDVRPHLWNGRIERQNQPIPLYDTLDMSCKDF